MAREEQNGQVNGLVRWQNPAMIAPEAEQAITSGLRKYAARIAALVGDPKVEVNQLLASVVLAVAKNDYLLKCEPTSLILAVLQGAREGITSFSGPFAQGYLVPFKGSVTLIHSYKYLIDVAMECGAIQGISFGAVHEKDTFDYQDGTKPFLTFKKLLKGDRGEFVNTFAVITLPGGSQRIDVLEFGYINRIREESLAKITREDLIKYSPWVQWPDEMAIKTQIRHALKTCGLNFDRHSRLVNLITDDDNALNGELPPQYRAIRDQIEPGPQQPSGSHESLRSMAGKAVANPLVAIRDDFAKCGTIDEVTETMARLQAQDESLKGDIGKLAHERIAQLR